MVTAPVLTNSKIDTLSTLLHTRLEFATSFASTRFAPIMSQIATKAAAALAKPLLPYLRHLPQPLLTLVPVLALHVAGHQEPTSISWFLDPMVNPMHPPILLTMVMIPCIYALGLVTGYISWVDKLWPFYTPLHSLLIVLWTIYNPSGAVYGHNLPRLGLMLLLQVSYVACTRRKYSLRTRIGHMVHSAH
jgi:hypothetical protein